MAEMSLADLAQYFSGPPRATGLAALAPGEGGAPQGANDPLNRPGYMQHVAQGLGQAVATPGAVMQQNPYPPGSEAAIMYDDQRQGAMSRWAPGMALSMLGAGAPMAEAGALGAAGGGLRNKFTGAFKAADAGTDLPKNQMYTNKTRAEAIAENSANARAPGAPELVQNTPVDPALVRANLDRMENPIGAEAARPQTMAERVDRWKAILQNGIGQ